MDNLTELYCLMDDFCKVFEPRMDAHLLAEGTKKRRRRSCSLSLAELMTLAVLFHQLRYRQFKAFYLFHACQYLRAEFPGLPSYSRCVELLPRCAMALTALFETLKGECTVISVADSTPIAVCDNLRISRHRVFKDMAERGKSSTGWFFGFKLHLVVNHIGEILSIRLTPGNTDDRKPLPELVSGFFGRLYADKGYISKALTKTLKQIGINLITKVRRNMKPVEHSDFDKAVLNRRSIIETVIDELKNLMQIEHTRHRSPFNFIVNLLGGIIAYCLMPKKPKIPVVFEKEIMSNAMLIPN